jgi:hypothetical protein
MLSGGVWENEKNRAFDPEWNRTFPTFGKLPAVALEEMSDSPDSERRNDKVLSSRRPSDSAPTNHA